MIFTEERGREGGKERERESNLLLYFALVVLDLVDVEQPGGGRLLGVAQLGGGAAVDVGLSDDRQAGVHRGRLVDVEDKVGVLDQVHPEAEGEAGGEGEGRGRGGEFISQCGG